LNLRAIGFRIDNGYITGGREDLLRKGGGGEGGEGGGEGEGVRGGGRELKERSIAGINNFQLSFNSVFFSQVCKT
jgi:hypothetical protein